MSFLFGKGSKVSKVSDLVKGIKDALAALEKNSKGNEKVRLHLFTITAHPSFVWITSLWYPLPLEAMAPLSLPAALEIGRLGLSKVNN
jgi:hypothetical protein